MPIAVILRRLFLISLLTLPQVYWLGRAWRISAHPRVKRSIRWIAHALIILLVLAITADLYDRISVKFLSTRLSYLIAPVVQLWIFSSTFAFYFMQPIRVLDWSHSLLKRLFRTTADDDPPDPSRRSLLHHTATIVGGLPFAAALYGYSLERLHFEVVRVNVPISNLPPALDGLRILQLSDIHIGDFMRAHEIRRAVDMANELAPHLAVVTGDFLSSRGDPLADCIAELSRIRAPLGTWGCNGNHEIYAGAEAEAESLFHLHGMRLLRQSSAQVHWNGAYLNLIGIDYARTQHFPSRSLPSVEGIQPLVRSDMPNILLSHNPNTFPSAAALGIELSLAGHTHGGQVNLEILHPALNPARFVTDFVAGLYRRPVSPASGGSLPRSAFLYVNRGLGTLAVPARLGSNPEITLLTLQSRQPDPH